MRQALLDACPDVHRVDANRIPPQARDEEIARMLGFDHRPEGGGELQPALVVQLRKSAPTQHRRLPSRAQERAGGHATEAALARPRLVFFSRPWTVRGG